MKTSVPGNSRNTAASISAALSTSTRVTPAGVGRLTGPATSTTSAPASRAACATANPILPELRLLMKRTGSMRSRVGPGGDQHAPAGERALRGAAAPPTLGQISTGSSMRPVPVSPQA